MTLNKSCKSSQTYVLALCCFRWYLSGRREGSYHQPANTHTQNEEAIIWYVDPPLSSSGTTSFLLTYTIASNNRPNTPTSSFSARSSLSFAASLIICEAITSSRSARQITTFPPFLVSQPTSDIRNILCDNPQSFAAVYPPTGPSILIADLHPWSTARRNKTPSSTLWLLPAPTHPLASL